MKKKKLILIQPQKYNELFSTYHDSRKTHKYLPKISSSIQKDWEVTAYTTKTNMFTSTNNKIRGSFSVNKNQNIFQRNHIFFNSLMTYQNSNDNSYKNEFLPFPSLTQRFKKTDERFRKRKKFSIKKSSCNIIYMNLSNQSNKSNKKFNRQYSLETIDKDKIVNKNIKEINNSKNQIFKEIFNINEKSKIKKDLAIIKTISPVLINLFAEDIHNKINMENKNGKLTSNNSKRNNIINKNKGLFDNINKTIYKNNTFFQYVLNNVKHKIEILNDSNKSVSVLYVMNLINKELSDLKKNLENVEKNLAIENNQFTSNNVSKISNYEFTPSNTFRFKTNNNNIKGNNDNNSGVLGNLIKNNIYSKTNDGTKRLNFENKKNDFKIKENFMFQNQEIIYSINQEESKGQIKSKNIKKINISKISKLRGKVFETGTNTEKENFFTSRSLNNSPVKIRAKNNFFRKNKNNNNEEKIISHSFSEIFLKENYPKASDFIKEISNVIESKFIIKNKNKIKNKDKQNDNPKKEFIPKNLKKNNKNSNNYLLLEASDKNNTNKLNFENQKENDYEYFQENNIITPKRNKEILEAFSDGHEKPIKIKDKKMNNNYQNIIINMQNIKQMESTTLTPRKSLEIKNINIKTDTSSSFYDVKQSSENQEPNLIYFGKDRTNQIIYEDNNNENNRKKNKKRKKKRNKNQDLTDIKTAKMSEKNIFNKINDNNMNINNIDDNIIINEKSKSKSRKRKKKEKEQNTNDLINNEQNILNNKENLFKINGDIKQRNEVDEIPNEKYIKEESYEEEEEEESYEYEGDEEEEDEEEEDDEEEIENEIGKNNNKLKNGEKKLIKKKKKKNQKNIENETSKKNKISNQSPINASKEITKNLTNKKSNFEIQKKINETENILEKSRNNIIDNSNINRVINESNNKLIIDKKKSKIIEKNNFKDRDKLFKKPSTAAKNIINENPEYKELVKEMAKYNVTTKNDLYNIKHLTQDKKEQKPNGGIVPKYSDNTFFQMDDNIDEILKKNMLPKKISKNFNKQEETKIFNEVLELDNLTKEEKNYVLSEMLNLRNIIIKAKAINKEIRNQINLKRVSLFKLVNKYFINLILNDIENKSVKREKYLNKLSLLEKIQNFGIFSYKNLEILEEKYVNPYFEQEEKRKREILEDEEKKLRKKLALEEFENYMKNRDKRLRKSQLIYDNSYLFKKDKPKDFKLRKEVEDILNKEYYEFELKEAKRSNNRQISLITKRKKQERRQRISKNKNIDSKLLKLKMENDRDEDNDKNRKELDEQRAEELKELKLKEFFIRIRKLKNGEFKDFDEELNRLINDIIMDKKDVVSKNRENRMNSFMQNFQHSRSKNKSKSKNRICFNFISPIRFISENNN